MSAILTKYEISDFLTRILKSFLTKSPEIFRLCQNLAVPSVGFLIFWSYCKNVINRADGAIFVILNNFVPEQIRAPVGKCTYKKRNEFSFSFTYSLVVLFSFLNAIFYLDTSCNKIWHFKLLLAAWYDTRQYTTRHKYIMELLRDISWGSNFWVHT